jgi:hypothetical protein
MDEGVAGRHRGVWRRGAGSLGRFASAPPRRVGPVNRGHAGAQHEIAVHPRHTIRLIIRRRGFRTASAALLMATPWFREQQLTRPNQTLRWEAESRLLTSLSRGLPLASGLTVVFLHFDRKSVKRAVPKTPATPAATSATSVSLDRMRRAVTRLGSACKQVSLEVRHVVRPDRAPHGQVPE